MINLEYKLDIFNQIILKEQELKSKEELEALKLDNDKLFEEKRVELEKSSNEIILRRIQLANSQKNEMISKARGENRERLLSIREELLEDLLLSLKEKARQFTKTSAYDDYLLNNIQRFIQTTSNNEVILTILANDIEKHKRAIKKIGKELNVVIEVEEAKDQIIGGFIISDQAKTYNLDSTFKTIIEENRYEIGKSLYSSLEKAGEVRG